MPRTGGTASGIPAGSPTPTGSPAPANPPAPRARDLAPATARQRGIFLENPRLVTVQSEDACENSREDACKKRSAAL